jgi:hypothetical protein
VFALSPREKLALERSSWWSAYRIRCWSRGRVAWLVRYGWCGVPIGASTVLVAPEEPLGSLAILSREVEVLLQKKAERRVSDPAGGGFVDAAFTASYPTLWMYLTQRRWDDGSERRTSTLTIFADGVAAKCLLKDRDAGLCLWVASESVLTLFEVLEAALCDGETEWRVDRQLPDQKASRVKRGR